MDEHDSMSSDRPWYYDLLMELDAEGWVIANVEDYLGAEEKIGSERLLYLEYALELSRSLQERTAYLGKSADERAFDLVEVWAGELNDPMNADRVLDEYESWAKDFRPWEPALYRSEEDWRDEGEEEAHASLLSRFDNLDPSSKPSTIVILPLLAYPAQSEAIEHALRAVEEGETRQRATIDRAIVMLGNEGYDVAGIEHMNILDGLDTVARIHDLHDMHEDLRLLIAEQIAPFDTELAGHHEQRRVALIEQGASADIGGLRLQISAIADNLHQRMAMLNDLLNDWRAKGILFPHTDGIRAGELLEWEANLPEIEATLQRHHAALLRWKSVSEVWPEEAGKAAHCAGQLEQTEVFIDFVDDLDQRWKQLELESIKRIEHFEHAGLAMDTWHERLHFDPKATLDDLKQSEALLQQRVDLLTQLSDLDASFEGGEDVEKRKDLLRELDVDGEIIEDSIRFIEHHARRGARHRRMLEQDWRGLVTQGKASESTATSSFTLAGFEAEVAHIRRFGTSVASTRTGASLIAGDVQDRLRSRLDQELSILTASGWSVEELRILAKSDTIVASRKLNAARPHIEEHATLMRRLVCLPWNRDLALALDVEASLRNPLKIASLNERVAGYAQHLAGRAIEDDGFEMTPWAPRPPRKTLLPIPEHGALPTMMPADTLEDAHEAILEAMEGASPNYESISKGLTAGLRPAIVRPNEAVIPPVDRLPSPQQKSEVSIRKTPQPVVKETIVATPHVNHPPQGIEANVSRDVASFLKAIGLTQLANAIDTNGMDALPEVRRGLAQHVGHEPRDTRIDRLLRLSLRLMPQGDESDASRASMLADLGKNTKKIKRWMRSRLEHRHTGSTQNFLDDAGRLGEALQRIPGPGFPVPLQSDNKELPDVSDLTMLRQEVTALIGQMNPASAGGIAV